MFAENVPTNSCETKDWYMMKCPKVPIKQHCQRQQGRCAKFEGIEHHRDYTQRDMPLHKQKQAGEIQTDSDTSLEKCHSSTDDEVVASKVVVETSRLTPGTTSCDSISARTRLSISSTD